MKLWISAANSYYGISTLTDENNLHSDIRAFSKQNDFVEISNVAVFFPSMEKKVVPEKAPLANNISIHLHQFLQQQGVDTHLRMRFERTQQSVVRTEQLKFDIRICNLPPDDLIKEFGIKEEETRERFPEPLVEFFMRPDSDGKPRRVSDAHLLAFDAIDEEDLETVNETALRINDLLTGVFFGIGVQLIDIRMEFGVTFLDEDDEEPVVFLISELSPDTMTLWDIKEEKRLDSSLAFTSEDGLAGYKEIARRFDLDSARATLARQSG